jgi:enoyl-CoA hydratase/carnithine racemase
VEFEDYKDRASTAEVTRDDAGVVLIRMHSQESSLLWGAAPHKELGDLFAAIASDRANRVVILTGTGDSFIEISDELSVSLKDGTTVSLNATGKVAATFWDQVIFEGNRLVNEMLNVDVPMIAAVNGPVTIHSELAVLCDIVLCTEQTYFQDKAHFPRALVPGDSMQVVWPMLLGPNRGRHFLLTGASLDAKEAQRLGVVAEIVEREELVDRARELAASFASLNPVLLRNTRHMLTRPIKRMMADDLHIGLALEAVASLSGREFYGSER